MNAPSPHKRLMNDRQKIVLETMRMRLTIEESLIYLQVQGYTISQATLERDKRKIEDLKLKRIYHIAQIGFEDQHLERIDILEIGQKFFFQQFLRETSPFRKSIIMEKIIAMQPYLSSYYEATKSLIETNENLKSKMIKHFSKEQLELIKSGNESVGLDNTDYNNIYSNDITKNYNYENLNNDDNIKSELDNTNSDNTNNGGFQYLNNTSKFKEGSADLPTTRTNTTTEGERISKTEGENHYRKQKERGIF